MRKHIIILILMLAFKIAVSQTLVEATYRYVTKQGWTTASDFVVITIENKNNGKVKELCVDVSSLYWSLLQEYNHANYNAIDDSLQEHSKDRYFNIENPDALDRLNFKKYNSRKVNKIRRLIERNSLIDSLRQLSKFREYVGNEYSSYVNARINKIDHIRDSILNKRTLTTEEEEILNKLESPFYDDHYNWFWDKLSNQGQVLIKRWNEVISTERDRITSLEEEIDRQEHKFFFKYDKRYGTVFCHALFYYGVICYQDCENGLLSFGGFVEFNK